MAKFCPNGHQMADTWEICPYCQKPGFASPPNPAAAAATRLESTPATSPEQPAAARKTVLLSETRKAPVVGWLVALDGAQKGEDFRIREGQNIIGSGADADIQLHDVTISSRHASLRYKDNKFVLSDLDSTNGTFLNSGSGPIAREELKDNDIVTLGGVSLKFKCL